MLVKGTFDLIYRGDVHPKPRNTSLTVEKLIGRGLVPPAARDMEAADIIHQFNETNGGEDWLRFIPKGGW